MSATPSPEPAAPWIVVDSPLLVITDGGWQTLLSLLAVVISACALLYTVSARPRVTATVQRYTYRDEDGVQVPDGDDVSVMNLGRASVVIKAIDAIGPGGEESLASKSHRGPRRERVEAPTFPLVIEPGKVVTVWMPVSQYGARAASEHGFRVTYFRTTWPRWSRPRTRTFVVKGERATLTGSSHRETNAQLRRSERTGSLRTRPE